MGVDILLFGNTTFLIGKLGNCCLNQTNSICSNYHLVKSKGAFLTALTGSIKGNCKALELSIFSKKIVQMLAAKDRCPFKRTEYLQLPIFATNLLQGPLHFLFEDKQYFQLQAYILAPNLNVMSADKLLMVPRYHEVKTVCSTRPKGSVF